MIRCRRSARLINLFCLFGLCFGSFAQDSIRVVIGTPNNQCRVVNSYPEYWVDGKPFFEHAAAFLYHRMPRDRWGEELLHFKEMGINTIDLYPFSNWHEPKEGVLDFDGHTNPRRDLKLLLRLIDSMGFKITLRPGPYFTGEWRNGGYPDWLMRMSEYHMSEQAVLEGRYPRLSALQRDQSDEAARGWLENQTHLKYTSEWYREVLGLFDSYLTEDGGPLINIQIDDDQVSFLYNYVGPDTWKYLDQLRKYAEKASHNSRLPYYLNGYDMRVNAAAGDATPEPFWNTGQDYESGGQDGYSAASAAASTKFLLEILKTQPLFVPGHIEFQAGWYLKDSDTYAEFTDPSNTLLATRVMFQNGLKLLNYYPLSDSVYPAGYEFPTANHFYSWEAPINYAGRETGRAVYVRRNGRLLAGMGALLASSHLLPDAGLVYPMATFPQASLTAAEANHVASFAERVLWSGVYDHLSLELVDSDHAPAENFQRYRVLVLPNLVTQAEDLKEYPHLEHYSERAQQAIRDYVEAGGTLIVFPSLPRGRIFDGFLAPLGTDHWVVGDAAIEFADDATPQALRGRSVLTLPEKRRTEVEVFARDPSGEIVGAKLLHGKGQVLFYGADFSLWSTPPRAPSASDGAGNVSASDYPEEVQKAARAALPGLMRQAGLERKVYPVLQTTKARDVGLYVTELVADAGSLPFERRANTQSGYGFVGVTNFSVDEARTAEIVVTNPRVADLASRESGHYLHLPRLTLPPRESLMLPLRVPLASQYTKMAPGLEAADEVYYATAELGKADYDGSTLRLEFTAPADGEVALRLTEHPERATLDGNAVPIAEDVSRNLFVVKIPKGEAPHFIRVLEMAYSRVGLSLKIDPGESWVVGEKHVVQVRVENPRRALFEGDLDLLPGRIGRRGHPPLLVRIPGHASAEFSFPVEIPPDLQENQPLELTATLRERRSSATWAWRSRVTVHHPFEYTLGPVLNFPLREDQPIPIVHPTLASVNLPGEAAFHIHVKNWRNHEQAVTLATEGTDLHLTPSSSRLLLPASGETTAEVRAAPTGGSGTYHFTINLSSGCYRVSEGVVLAAVRPGEAIAYSLDYDRDGFDDVVLENQRVRLFVSPDAGGRAFGLVLKDSNTNAFDSVGGMRDNFSTRFEPDDMKGLTDWTRANWLGLYNRPYSLRIVSPVGSQAKVQLDYFAPDIYPQGARLERTLTLAGDQNVVLEETSVTPRGAGKAQAYVLETSVPFRVFREPNYNLWFVQGRSAEEFVPPQKVELDGTRGFVGTVNKQTSEMFALLELTQATRTEIVPDEHSALFRIIYPTFDARDHTYRYRAAYYFGKTTREELESLFVRLKAARDQPASAAP